MIAVMLERGRHRDHEDIGGHDLGRGLEHTALNDAAHQPVEIDFLDMDLAAIDCFDNALRHVDAGHGAIGPGNDGRRREPDIAEPDYAHFRFGIAAHCSPAV